MSSGGRRAVVWPPPHRRDRQRRSLARTDPARRGKPAWVPESVRLATTVGDLQGDVFIEGSALDRLPTITFRRKRPHCAFPNFRAMAPVSAALGFNPRPGREITSVPRGVSPSRGCPGSRDSPERDNALEAHLASLPEDGSAVLIGVLAEDDADPSRADQSRKPLLTVSLGETIEYPVARGR
jgi:hypothetical protein